jgi:RNA polymerase sigma-70 factor (ECF subfamily)
MTTATELDSNEASLTQKLERLFREHSTMVYRTAYGVTGNREDAQDILQTIFLRLLRSDSARDAQQDPKAYLYRAAVNLSLDTLKTRRRRPFVRDVDHTQVAAPNAAATIDEDHSRLYEAVASLPPESREIVILRYIHEYSDSKIATMLGKSRVAVAVSLFRSRARLKKLLQKQETQRS